MGRPPVINPRIGVGIRVDPDTIKRVRALLANPVSGRTRYKSLSDLIDRLLLDYVIKETQARSAQPKDPQNV